MSRSVHLEVVRAVGLKDVQKASKCAARVEIHYHKKEVLKTKEVKKTLDPVFNEKVTFPIKEEETEPVRFYITVKSGGKEMGTAVYEFAKYVKSPNPCQLPLLYKGNEHGHLHLNVFQRTPAAYRNRLCYYLEKHLPDKVSNVDTYLEKHPDEDEFFEYLTKKYGPEPPPAHPYRERLSRFLEYHLPGKLRSLDTFLKQSPNESEMFTYLVTKYGPEPSDEDLEMQREMVEEGQEEADESEPPASPSLSPEQGRRASQPPQEEETATKSVSERVHEIYSEISPEKIKTIPKVLEGYKGREADLLKSLEARLADHRSKHPPKEETTPSPSPPSPEKQEDPSPPTPDAHTSEDATLQEQLSELTTKLKEFRHENKSLKAMVEESEGRTQSLQTELAAVKSKKSSGGDAELVEALEAREEELCEENVNLQEEIKKLRESIAAKEAKENDKGSSSDSSKSSKSSGGTKKKKKSEIISELRESLSRSQQEVDDKNTKIKVLEEAVQERNDDSGLLTELEILREQTAELQTQLQAQNIDGKLSSLEEENAHLKSEIANYTDTVIPDLESQLKALSSEDNDTTELLQSNAIMKTEIEKLTNQLADASTTNSNSTDLQAKIEDLEEKLAVQQNSVQTAKIETHDTSELEIEIETLRGDVAILQLENQKLSKQVQSTAEPDTSAADEISKLKSESESLNELVSDLRTQLETETEKVSSQLTKIGSLEQEMSTQQSKLDGFKSREKEIEQRESLLRHKESATGQSFTNDDLALREAKIEEAERRIEATQSQINQQTKRLHEEVRRKSEEADARLTAIACKEEEFRITQLESQKAMLQNNSPRNVKRVSINTPPSPSKDKELLGLRKECDKLKQKCLQLEIDNNVLSKEKESSASLALRKLDYERAEAAVAEKLRAVAKREQELTEREQLLSQQTSDSEEVKQLREQLSTIEALQSRELEVISKTEAADSLLSQVKEKEIELVSSRAELSARWTELNEAEVHFNERRRDEDALAGANIHQQQQLAEREKCLLDKEVEMDERETELNARVTDLEKLSEEFEKREELGRIRKADLEAKEESLRTLLSNIEAKEKMIGACQAREIELKGQSDELKIVLEKVKETSANLNERERIVQEKETEVAALQLAIDLRHSEVKEIPGREKILHQREGHISRREEAMLRRERELQAAFNLKEKELQKKTRSLQTHAAQLVNGGSSRRRREKHHPAAATPQPAAVSPARTSTTTSTPHSANGKPISLETAMTCLTATFDGYADILQD